MNEHQEQLLISASFALAALVDAVMRELPNTTQRVVAQALENGGNLVVVSTLIPQPEFRILLATPPAGHTVELAHCVPPIDALVKPPMEH